MSGHLILNHFSRRRMRAWSVAAVLAALAVAWGGCQKMEPAPCDDEERTAQQRLVQDLSTAVRDSVVHVFEQKNRVERVLLDQAGCHFRATLYVDGFASKAYARAQAEQLIRLLKEEAPAETPPLDTGIETGLYDYVVTVHRSGSDPRRPLVRAVKRYDADRLLWS